MFFSDNPRKTFTKCKELISQKALAIHKRGTHVAFFFVINTSCYNGVFFLIKIQFFLYVD